MVEYLISVESCTIKLETKHDSKEVNIEKLLEDLCYTIIGVDEAGMWENFRGLLEHINNIIKMRLKEMEEREANGRRRN